MKRFFLLIALFAFISSCNKGVPIDDPVEIPEKDPEIIQSIPQLIDPNRPWLGRWKLSELIIMSNGVNPFIIPDIVYPSLDYSESEVYFTFYTNGILPKHHTSQSRGG